MADSIENEAVEAVEGFDFAQAERLVKDDKAKPSDDNSIDDDEGIEGELQTEEEAAKMQARSFVGLLDMSFAFMGNEKYKDHVYSEGERHLYPAIVRLSFRIPAIEYINAAIWTAFRLIKSIKEVKHKGKKEDAKQQQSAPQQ